jgi:hypothetical protein
MRFFPSTRNFKSLSIRDLLDAREAYHVHLANLPNVVGTAIGLYRIRKQEANANQSDKEVAYGELDEPRRLDNTVVKPWSWPCLLVFVDRWLSLEEFRSQPDLSVPRRLYLPDGRVIPTCVIHAPKAEKKPRTIEKLGFASHLLGGGYPVFTKHQGAEQVGSVACLVTDGESTFALTNRHVTGRAKRPVYTLLHGHAERVGSSADKQLGKMPFEQVYRGWSGSRAYVNLDAGLIKVSDVNAWTSQVFGIGEVGELVDMHPDTASLDLIGLPVRAFGGASGALEGEVQALFYRYRSVGGADFVADMLIGPRAGRPVMTLPGDSGTLWFVDPPSGRRGAAAAAAEAANGATVKKASLRRTKEASEAVDAREPAPEVGRKPRAVEGEPVVDPNRGLRARRLSPIALQWGGERLDSGAQAAPVQFALATFLSTVCRELDVELVRSWNAGHSEYWGKIGHFKIGAKACELVSTKKLKAFMRANKKNVGFDDDVLEQGKQFSVGRDQFIPLADVPDYVWISASHGGGNSGRTHEGGQHFADMDQPGAGRFARKTLLSLCNDPSNVSADVWKEFYDEFPDDLRPEEGVLPFRVWQLYEAMVDHLKKGEVAEFLAAAGTMAHYVGDACQPLHVSHLHHGRGPEGGRHSPDWPAFKKSPEYKIHAIYEQGMFEVAAVEMLAAINESVEDEEAKPALRGGYAAACATVDLMTACHKKLPPTTIIDADDPEESAPERGRILWKKVGRKTAGLVGEGCMLLATLWESAWKEAGAEAKLDAGDLGVIEEEELSTLVRRRNFLPAFTLEELVAKGFTAPDRPDRPARPRAAGTNGARTRRRGRRSEIEVDA